MQIRKKALSVLLSMAMLITTFATIIPVWAATGANGKKVLEPGLVDDGWSAKNYDWTQGNDYYKVTQNNDASPSIWEVQPEISNFLVDDYWKEGTASFLKSFYRMTDASYEDIERSMTYNVNSGSYIGLTYFLRSDLYLSQMANILYNKDGNGMRLYSSANGTTWNALNAIDVFEIDRIEKGNETATSWLPNPFDPSLTTVDYLKTENPGWRPSQIFAFLYVGMSVQIPEGATMIKIVFPTRDAILGSEWTTNSIDDLFPGVPRIRDSFVFGSVTASETVISRNSKGGFAVPGEIPDYGLNGKLSLKPGMIDDGSTLNLSNWTGGTAYTATPTAPNGFPLIWLPSADAFVNCNASQYLNNGGAFSVKSYFGSGNAMNVLRSPYTSEDLPREISYNIKGGSYVAFTTYFRNNFDSNQLKSLLFGSASGGIMVKYSTDNGTSWSDPMSYVDVFESDRIYTKTGNSAATTNLGGLADVIKDSTSAIGMSAYYEYLGVCLSVKAPNNANMVKFVFPNKATLSLVEWTFPGYGMFYGEAKSSDSIINRTTKGDYTLKVDAYKEECYTEDKTLSMFPVAEDFGLSDSTAISAKVYYNYYTDNNLYLYIEADDVADRTLTATVQYKAENGTLTSADAVSRTADGKTYFEAMIPEGQNDIKVIISNGAGNYMSLSVGDGIYTMDNNFVSTVNKPVLTPGTVDTFAFDGATGGTAYGQASKTTAGAKVFGNSKIYFTPAEQSFLADDKFTASANGTYIGYVGGQSAMERSLTYNVEGDSYFSFNFLTGTMAVNQLADVVLDTQGGGWQLWASSDNGATFAKIRPDDIYYVKMMGIDNGVQYQQTATGTWFGEPISYIKNAYFATANLSGNNDGARNGMSYLIAGKNYYIDENVTQVKIVFPDYSYVNNGTALWTQMLTGVKASKSPVTQNSSGSPITADDNIKYLCSEFDEDGRLNKEILGKLIGWDIVYCIEENNFERILHWMEFLDRVNQPELFAENFIPTDSGWKFNDPGNGEQCAWLCWGIAKLRKKLGLKPIKIINKK